MIVHVCQTDSFSAKTLEVQRKVNSSLLAVVTPANLYFIENILDLDQAPSTFSSDSDQYYISVWYRNISANIYKTGTFKITADKFEQAKHFAAVIMPE